MKTYDYTNDLGVHKRLIVYPLENGKHPISLWCMDNGEFVGSGHLTPEELKNWLVHYGIKE